VSCAETILLVDDDRSITEGLAAALERSGRTTIICSDVEAAEILLAKHPITHLVTDVQFSGDFGFEGLHFIGRARKVAPNCRIVMMTGHVTGSLERAAKAFGASEVLAKPFTGVELEAALGTSGAPAGAESEYQLLRFPGITEVIASEELAVAYQPILRIADDEVEPFAFEALTRVKGQWLFGGPETLFEYAERRGQLVELNLAAIERAIANAGALPGEPMIFVNVDPQVFTSQGLLPALLRASQRSAVSLSRIVLEVTERSGFDDEEAAAQTFETLRCLGLRFALDDHASAYSHFGMIEAIRPSFIKISNAFGTDFETNGTRSRIVRHIAFLAHDLGCQTVLEGVESEATTGAAREIGIDLVQGYHYGPPNGAAHWSRLTANAA
jgi:EAL domain-containing protein (putative c-di-GMP-specific phosphodiesterase class I)/ActR/RegA family two-component response regulator